MTEDDNVSTVSPPRPPQSRQPWALSLPDQELCLREALAVCTPPAPEPSAPIPPSIRVFSNEPTLRMRWPMYWSFNFSIIPSKDTGRQPPLRFELRTRHGPEAGRVPAKARDVRGTGSSLGWEDPLEEETPTRSSILAWRIPWTEEPGRLQSMMSQRVGHY